jgi:hypothetical protein
MSSQHKSQQKHGMSFPSINTIILIDNTPVATADAGLIVGRSQQR